MELNFLSSINYLAVTVSSLIFFVIGSLWFSALFSSTWVHELKRHNVTIHQPSQTTLLIKMLLTFGANFLASFAMACLVILTGSHTASSGLTLGLISAFGFAATAIGSVFVWENRSVKLFLIDSGYPVLGIIAAAVLLSVWR